RFGGGGILVNDRNTTTTLTSTIVGDNRESNRFASESDIDVKGSRSGPYRLDATTSSIEVGWRLINGIRLGNLFAIDPQLDPIGLQDNGGLTQTVALLASSPVIDAGSSPNGLTADQRGAPRTVDGDTDGTAVIDIGAFEFLPPAQTTVSLDGAGNLSIIGVSDDALALEAIGSTLRVSDPTQPIAAGNGVASIDPNTVEVPLSSLTGTITVATFSGTDSVSVSGVAADSLVLIGGTGADNFQGSLGGDLQEGRAGNDDLNGSLGRDTLLGGDGEDILDGGDSADSIDGGSGNDILQGGRQNDSLDGSSGDDTLDGGQGNDSIFGDSGNDSLRGGSEHDTLSGTTGNDTLHSGFGNDILWGGADEDTLEGYYGDDTLAGGFGDDILFGNVNDDRLAGNTGDDTLFGGEGNDTLFGSGGDDVLIGVGTNNDGGRSFDILWGEAGADRYVLGRSGTVFYDDGLSFTDGVLNQARIHTFDSAEGDVIQLAGSASDYRLGEAPSGLGATGTGIYLTATLGTDELIAVVVGVTGLNLTASYFDYV
ncbi:MAG: calcium-binding protein, partial [Cyanobacteria bacterium J06639_1]